jgi:hypothetical protein
MDARVDRAGRFDELVDTGMRTANHNDHADKPGTLELRELSLAISTPDAETSVIRWMLGVISVFLSTS